MAHCGNVLLEEGRTYGMTERKERNVHMHSVCGELQVQRGKIQKDENEKGLGPKLTSFNFILMVKESH